MISGALNSAALACTVILSLPPLALSTSAANWLMLTVWKLVAGYAVARSHWVWAKAEVDSASAAAAIESWKTRRFMGAPVGGVEQIAGKPCGERVHGL
ncbi:hypothetical protein D9M68_846170 [compost metagenome]